MIGFSDQELERARRFHRPRYAALVLDLAASVAALALLTRLDVPLRWWIAAIVTPLAVDLAVWAVRIPTGFWRHRHDRAWELSNQSDAAWALDALKGAAVGGVLAVAGLAPLFAAAHWFPTGWPWLAAAGAALLVLLLGLVAPVVLEPVFNRFEPLADGDLARRLHRLAERAGAPVREILVADASRRTSRQNAYVSGIGRTRRVVLWDTLLAAPPDEVAVVLAHELGHRVRRHVVVLTVAGMAGAAAFVLVLRVVMPHPRPADTAAVLLVALALELAAQPGLSALSRRFERVADRFSLDLTGDRVAYQALHRRLALANLADLTPPKWLYYWMFSHPTPPERLRAV